jgi:predicted dehydrogenase
MSRTTRRGFLKSSALAVGAGAFAGPVLAQAGRSANDRIRVGLVGMGNRMGGHIAALAQLEAENVEIAAICDCDHRRIDTALQNHKLLADRKVAVFRDQRALFDDKSIDAVSFSTQDHWHALQTIWACQAGKDVYIEKPVSHTIEEGRRMVEAARKYQRMVQVGTQNRTSPNIVEGIRKLREGAIGKLYMARGMSYKMRGHLGRNQPEPVPDGLDWDAWVGPARMVPYGHLHHRYWYWNSNFASGDIANQTIHNIDIIRWGLGLDVHPDIMMSLGGRYVPAEDDDCDTPNTQSLICQWEGRNVQVTFEIRHWYTNSEAEMRDKYPFVAPNQVVGVIFFGSEGYMLFPDYSSYYVFLGPTREPGPHAVDPERGMVDLPHFRNWIAACRSRRHQDLTADIEEGHLSTAVCHLAKISNQLRRSVHFDPTTERFLNDPEADRLLTREYREPYALPREV